MAHHAEDARDPVQKPPELHYTARIKKKPTRNPQQRRRELCNAAIQVLADEGAKGLSHLKVDRQAGFPDGTTSVHFRTRNALIHAIAARVAELDEEEFFAATDTATTEGSADLILSRLADVSMRAAQEPALSRTKARYELLMQAPRDPVLMESLRAVTARFAAMSQEAVAQLQPPGAALDSALINDQAFAITTFIAGLHLGYIYGGERQVESAEKLENLLHAVIDGVALRHQKTSVPHRGVERNSRVRQ
jgi:DNA-binding transcriptional regulator YbjK